jgi:phosphoribosylformimino-5-aminoimidazole carboxamide ribotide isomerase
VELIPAIDLLDGRVVRLSQGDFDAVTQYGDDPLEVARRWRDEGATRIHLVDLDAARERRSRQSVIVERVVSAVGVPCQVAGGIRDEAAVAALLEAGADRVVLGSALISEADLARRLIEDHGAEHIVAALDVRDGKALGDGWVSGARDTAVSEHAASLSEQGVRWFAVTSIARDGGMGGPDLELLARVRRAVPGASVIASGGIGSIVDLRALAALGFPAAIVGRALYEGAFTLPEAIRAATDEP